MSVDVEEPRWSTQVKAWAGLGVLLALLATAARAQRLVTFVDPMVLRSPSGAWQLRVDPSTLSGRGPARYELAHDEQPVWAGDLDVTLTDLAVSDSGAFAGAAAEQPDGLHLFLVGPDGKVRAHDILPREASVVDGPTYPLCGGV